MQWYMWVTIILSFALGIGGGLLTRFVAALRESGEFLIDVADALEDGKITRTEQTQLIRSYGEAQGAWGGVVMAVLSIFRRR